MNSNTSESLPAKDILKGHYRNTEIFQSIQNTYFIGIIDESIFREVGLFDERYSYKQALEQADKNYEGLMFFALELAKHPTRTEMSDLTRAFNRISQKMPVALLLKYDNSGEAVISISISERFKFKQSWRQGEKAGKVIILRDIHTKTTHAGHIRILKDLVKPVAVINYAQLHENWLEVLDVSILNKRFFQELANWYFWAMNIVEFPDDVEKDKELRNATNLIRLITRIIFIWFIKEKKLVPNNLFRKDFLKNSVVDFMKNNKSENYYQAILQNLFFGTLNQVIEERGFVKEGTFQENKAEYGVKNLFRYAEKFFIPEKDIKELFADIPFLNGGLFDCLDKPDDEGKIIYVDGFSRNPKKQAHIPDYVFFSDEREIDLNEIYGTRSKRHKVLGLVNLLESYKFTVAENTPLEEEIALDPELLGKVFENLLASYNPETKTTARKQTGSFYTPREIVNYMVDESLIEYLLEQFSSGEKDFEERLRELFSYSVEVNPLSESETKTIIEALNSCKIIDPACGSGAFPMGILQKMVHLLNKLDSGNKIWKELQKEKAIAETKTAFEINDHDERKRRLDEIEDVFENNTSDYGRKLFLIENCIYGVDIQPIAVQIAKLRFFISLIIDQIKQEQKENFGIRSLPNLETKFVAANTLISLEKPQLKTGDVFLNEVFLKINDLSNQLKEIRHNYFNAKIRREKLKFQNRDKELRKEISNHLIKVGHTTINAHKIASFDPYDQNHFANWFEPEWMFGKELANGFDIIIGNPPYIKEYTFRNAFDGVRNSPYYQGKMDIWYLFACNGLDLLKKDKGVLCFIATNNWTTNAGASKMRSKIIDCSIIHKVLDFGSYMIFESADIQTMVMLFKNNNQNDNYTFELRRLIGNNNHFEDVLDLINKKQSLNAEYLNPTISKVELKDKTLTFSVDIHEPILNKIFKKGNFKLNANTEVAQGIVIPQDKLNKSNQKLLGDPFKVGQGIFVLSQEEIDSLELNNNEIDLLKPYFTTQQLHKWGSISDTDEWIIYTDSRFKYSKTIKPYPNIKKHLDRFQPIITSDNKPYGLHRAREEKFFKNEKLIVLRKCANEPVFTYTDFDAYVSATFYVIKSERINQKYLCAILNSKLIAFWLRNKGKMQGGNYQIDKEPLLQIPLFDAPESEQIRIIELVNKILLNHRNIDNSNINSLEKQIDNWVYKLYGLNEDEVKIVEGI
ncbi:MAG TPA: TaqI-like C-terminal specificity domain-containing protein [Ignavibacteriaceae bacterium]|nr:TaqI-like C-terminal specificity domain-containing protein [Ignavibacteriaceae bacterium]